MSLITVVIPTYNASLLIERTVESVQSQKGGYDVEIVVVDDCSTDETVQVVERLKLSNLRLLRQEHNQGPAAARNRGLREALGSYCAFLDGDDYWEPGFLAETVGFLEAHPECVAASVMQCHKIIGKEPSIAPQDTGVSAPLVLDDFWEFWGKYNHVCTGSVLFRTEVAQQIGGQREELRICEDLEFWAMLALNGKWGFIPKVLFTSDGGAVTRSQGWLEKNMIRWQNAPSFSEWRRRIDGIPSEHKTPAMEAALGRIARNLCYCHIMAGKKQLARQEVLEFGRAFPRNRVNSLFKAMAKCGLAWGLWCAFLRYREFHRSIG